MVRMPVLGNRWSVGVIATMIALWSSASGAKVRADVVRESSDPILRLDLPGHTGEVRALAFTPDSARLISGGRDKLAIVWTLDTDDLDVDGDDGRPQPGPAMVWATRTQQELFSSFLPWRSQWNFTFTRPYLSV
jgi:WD40 repeat protein